MKLKTGYLISGIITGLVVLFTFLGTLPDGKLHITFCDVGQGDGAYVRFPDGRDMVVDGGPNDKIIECLGKVMPFWDRSLDMVFMTHPQKDHMQGLITVFDRYTVGYFVRSDIKNSSEGYVKLMELVKAKNITQKFMTQGETISIGSVALRFLWPSQEQIAKGNFARGPLANLQGVPLSNSGDVMGATTVGDLNDYSLVFALRYGSFDALFTGDADTRVEHYYVGNRLADNQVEVLKVPHHGSKTGMNQAFADWVNPKLSIISVGKNSYGHPSKEAIDMLQSIGSKIVRTDQDGNIEVISDGKGWRVEE